MKLKTLFSGVALNKQTLKKAMAFLMITLMTIQVNAASSIFATILSNSVGQTIITTLFVMWGAIKLIEAFGKVMDGSGGAVKEGMQAIVLMVIGWQWSEIISLFGFDRA